MSIPKNGLFRTERMRLRAVEPEDLDFFYQLENDATMWSYTHSTVPYSRFALRRYLEQSENNFFTDGTLPLVMELNDGTRIGTVDLYGYMPIHKRVELGLVVQSQWRRQGYGQEALGLTAEYVRMRLLLHQIYAHVSESNIAARALFQRAGFKEVAILPDWYCNGYEHFEAACMYSLILQENQSFAEETDL